MFKFIALKMELTFKIHNILKLAFIIATIAKIHGQPFIEKKAKRKLQEYIKLQSLKVNLLSRMGLTRRPSLLRGEQKASRKVLGKLDNNDTFTTTSRPTGSGNYFAEIQEVVSLSEPAENVTDENIFQFKIVKDSQGRKLEVQSANLLVKLKYKMPKRKNRRKAKRRRGRKIRLELSSVSDKGKQKEIITSLKAVVYKTNWFKLAIPKELVEEKLEADDPHLKLHIKCFGCKKGAKLILVHGSPRRRKRRRYKNSSRRSRNKKRKGRKRLRKLIRIKRKKLSRTRPFLLLHTKVRTYFRQKRDVEETCSENEDCCKAPFEFNFKEVGWEDWVISPPSFTTAFCGGNCLSNSILRGVHSTNNCTETGHSDLRIIYYDHSGSIIISLVPNMIVTECGCGR